MPGQWFVVTRQFLAHENEIDLQTAQMPESMCGQYLSHDLHVTEVANHDDDDRQIPRNALSPKRTLTLGAAAETRRRRLKIGSSTAPMLLVRWRVSASGFSSVRPRPRNWARSVSNFAASMEDSGTMRCAAQTGRSSEPRRRRRATRASQRGSHSVSMKSLLKAGCARSVRCGARASSK